MNREYPVKFILDLDDSELGKLKDGVGDSGKGTSAPEGTGRHSAVSQEARQNKASFASTAAAVATGNVAAGAGNRFLGMNSGASNIIKRYYREGTEFETPEDVMQYMVDGVNNPLNPQPQPRKIDQLAQEVNIKKKSGGRGQGKVGRTKASKNGSVKSGIAGSILSRIGGKAGKGGILGKIAGAKVGPMASVGIAATALYTIFNEPIRQADKMRQKYSQFSPTIMALQLNHETDMQIHGRRRAQALGGLIEGATKYGDAWSNLWDGLAERSKPLLDAIGKGLEKWGGSLNEITKGLGTGTGTEPTAFSGLFGAGTASAGGNGGFGGGGVPVINQVGGGVAVGIVPAGGPLVQNFMGMNTNISNRREIEDAISNFRQFMLTEYNRAGTEARTWSDVSKTLMYMQVI